jgi:uncharacterized protein YeaO (DUF488 family)
MKKLGIKRVYEAHETGDGQRVLVDRLWPRGITKERLCDALWLKDLAPSAELRTWFGHKPERWEGFLERYFVELEEQPDALAKLRALMKKGPVTLLYSARDPERNQAAALRRYLEGR